MPTIATPPGWTEVPGIFVGGCVERGDGSSFRHAAHAHTHRTDTFKGWICVRAARRVFTPSGQPSRLLLHEYAHILQPSAGHGPAWQKRVAALGAPSEAVSYRKNQALWRAQRGLGEIVKKATDPIVTTVVLTPPKPIKPKRTRKPTSLPKEIETAYQASVDRRGKTSRADYAAGYEDGYEAALAAVRKRVGTLLLKGVA